MRKDFLTLISGIVFVMLADSRLAAQDNSNLPTLLVAPFSGNKAQIPEWQPAAGQCISEMLIEALENSDSKFKVLQLTDAAGPQTETKPGKSTSPNGETRDAKDGSGSSEKSDASGSAGSDFTFYGDVSQLTIQTNGSQIGDFLSANPLATLGIKVVTAHVQIEWCITDTGTKKVIKRGTTACFASGSALNMAALAASNGKAAAVQSAAAPIPAAQNSVAHAKTAATPAGGKGGAIPKPTVNDIFNGLGKAFGNAPGNAPNGESGGENAKDNSGTTAKLPKVPSKAGGEVAGNDNETLGYENPEFLNSAFGKATSKAVANIVGQLASVSLPESSRVANLNATTDALKHTPGKVLAVAGKDTIIVSLGGKEGFKEGDILELYQPTDVKDDKGNVVFTDEKSVGEITLSAVQEERSRGSYAGDAQVQQGWTVKAK